MKKNNDKSTFIVMPLTSSSNGVGINKYELGQISSLPNSLKGNGRYAVFNQIRTLNATRFIALKEGNNGIECQIGQTMFFELLIFSIKEIVYTVPQEQRI